MSVPDHCLSFYFSTVGLLLLQCFCWFAVEYSSCFISVTNLDLYVRCFDSLMGRGPSRGPNKFYVYPNHNRTWSEVARA